MHDRKELRRALRTRRGALDAATRQQAAASVCARVVELACYRNAQHVAAYVAIGGELDPGPLLQTAHAQGKQIYLPRIPPRHPGILQFCAWRPGAALQPNRLGIPEPAAADSKRIAPEMLDLVLVPVLGFDDQGHRLGMGGGYYDRTFTFLKTGVHHPFLLGLGYEFQRLENLVPAAWDVSLDGIVTESGCRLMQPEPSLP